MVSVTVGVTCGIEGSLAVSLGAALNRLENQPVSVFPFGTLSRNAARLGEGVLAGLGDGLFGGVLASSPDANLRIPESTPPSAFGGVDTEVFSEEKNGILSLLPKNDSSAGLVSVCEELSGGTVDMRLERDFLKGLKNPVSSELLSGFGSDIAEVLLC